MCGFAGTLNGDIRRPADPRLTDLMAAELQHRGPDNQGTFSDGPYAVSHQRLNIIDLTPAGRQPMQNEAGTISIAYNGEVYNFQELRDRHALDRKFAFRSRTDTEVLLNLYETMGIEFVNELNGMFAMAIWDSRTKTLYLIRDRFGIKPLFYALAGDSIWFASEIKGILTIPGFERKPCLEALYHYFSFNYIPGEITAFEGIKEVRPGCWLEAHSGPGLCIAQSQYWRPHYGSEKPGDLRAVVGDIRELLASAVRSQLISDVPVGVMLSGGLDSSTLTVLMSKLRKNSSFHTFSIGFDEKSFDESGPAGTVAAKVGTIHHRISIKPGLVAERLETQARSIDEPYADGSAIPTYLLAQEAKNYVTVLLSGEGGDEVFAGYDTHLAYKVRKIYRKNPASIRKLFQKLARLMPVSFSKLSLDFKVKRFVQAAEFDVPLSHYKWREVFSEAEKRHLFVDGNELERRFGLSGDLFRQQFEAATGDDELNKLLSIDCSFHLPDDLMIKNDRMTMAHSLEARVPFTDVPLFEYVAGLSSQMKIHGFTLKYLLKRAMENDLPREIIQKKKIGLEIPYSKWFCSELRDLLLDHLSEASLREIPFLDRRFVLSVVDEHLRKKRDRGRELWGLLNFVIWHRHRLS